MRFLVYIVLLLIPVQAKACVSTFTSDPEIVIERAVFIGKVKVLEKKDAKAKLLPLEIYKGEIKESLLADSHSFTSCGKNIPPEGTIYEEIIFEYKEGKYMVILASHSTTN
jgi:hypothetical protein